MGTTISALPAASLLGDADVLAVVQGGTTKKCTRAQILDYVSVKDYGATGNGVTDDTAAIQSALTAAQSAASVRLYFPSGTYLVSGATGNLFASSTNDLEIFGDGIGKTTIKFASGQTLTGSVTIFNLSGQDQSLHDLSITVAGVPQAALSYTSVAGGGSGYTAADTLTLTGGTFSVAATVIVDTVAGGVITAAHLGTGGTYTYPGVSATFSVGVYGATGGTGTGATFNLTGPQLHGVDIAAGALSPRTYNLDISGMWGLNTAGGAGLTANQPAQTNAFSTTLGSTFAAGGVQTVTPGSMAGIYPGMILRITGTNPETINVTSTTPTTFTATFASAHNATDTINGWSLGAQFGLYDTIYVHDCLSASGFVIASSKNVFRNCRAVNIGTYAKNQNQHGFYLQQGGNKFHSCCVEGAAGFNWHNHVGSGAFADNSGNEYTNCWSVNPGFQHFLADSATADGTDPSVPSGQPLNRYTQLIGCVFKCTVGANNPANSVGVGIQTGGAIIQGCTFEDTCINGTWLTLASNSSSVKQTAVGNVFRCLNTSALGSSTRGVSCGNNAIVQGNEFIGFSVSTTYCLQVNGATGNCLISGNQFDNSSSGGGSIQIAASGMNNIIVSSNVFTQGGSNNSACINVSTASTGLQIFGNNATLSSGAHFFRSDASNPTGQIHDNLWTGSTGGFRFTDTAALLDVYSNNGIFNFNNTTTNCMALDSKSGHLLRIAPGAGTLTGGLAVNQAGTANSLTTDTVFLGFAVCNKDATSGAFLVAGWAPGQIVEVTTDGAWTAGNVGILSSTAAGKIHDTAATTIPAAGTSYGILLDSGGVAGTARFLVMRTTG